MAGAGGRSATNGKKFARAMRKATEALAMEVDGAVRQTALELYRALVERTPRASGRAASGFTISRDGEDGAGDPGTDETPVVRASGTASVPKTVTARNEDALKAIPPFAPVVISNDVPYLDALENGDSRHAPGGFIALSVREAETKLKDRLRKLANKKR